MKNPSKNIDSGFQRVQKDSQLIGLGFGLVMGIAFLLGAWGMDVLELSGASAMFPWLRFGLGAVLVIPVFVFTGWLVARSDNSFVGLVSWLFAAVLISFWAGHVPYEAASWAVGKLLPDFQGVQVYPFGESAQTRWWIVAAVAGVLLAIGGVLQTNVLDSARTTTSAARRLFMFIVCVPFFLLAGVFTDMMIQQPLRQPVVAVDDLIQLALDVEGQEVDREIIFTRHLGAVNPILAELHKPRRLVLGDYSLSDLSATRVLIDFDGTWARCYVVADQPSYCQPSVEFFKTRVACLWESQGLGSQDCKIQLAEPAQAWFERWREQAGDPWSLQPETQVRIQQGVVSFLTIKIGQEVFECRVRDDNGISFEACGPAPSLPVPGRVQPSATPTLPPVATAEPTEEKIDFSDPEVITQQSQALLPQAQADLIDLLPLTLYEIEVTLNLDQTFAGNMTVTYVNQEAASLDRLYFHLFPNGGASYGNGSLDVSNVKVDSHAVDTELSVDDSVLEVPLPDLLEPRQAAQVDIAFAGTVPIDYGGEETDAYGIYNFSQNVLALSGWYPILAVYDEAGWHLNPPNPVGDSVFSDTALYAVKITTASDQVLVATGLQVNEVQTGELVQHQYVSGPVRDFFIIQSPDFKVMSQVVDGTEVHAYYLPGLEYGGAQALDVAAGSVRAFNRYFGAYPFTEFDVVSAPMRNAGGVEFPGIVLIEAGRYEDAESSLFVNTVAHEVAHQWWYSVVGNDVIEEPWLDEGLTTFSAGLYFEDVFGPEGYQGALEYWQQYSNKAVDIGRDEPITRTLTYFETNNTAMYGPVVYGKGALFFHELRQKIGDEAFFAGLQLYFQQFKYQIATAGDVLAVFEETSGEQLDPFYEQWIYPPASTP